MAARAVAPEGLERDPLAAAWLPFLSQGIVGNRTGFTKTTVVPQGAAVELSPAYGARLRSLDTAPWMPSVELPADEAALVELVREDMLDNVASLARLPAGSCRADITGGRDSRLILALLLAAGLADGMELRTTGEEHAPDAVVGRAIAERFGLAHRLQVPAPMPEEQFLGRLATHVFQTSGMVSAHTLKGGVGCAPGISMSGVMGELFRANHWVGRLDSVGALVEGLDRTFPLDALGILRPDVEEELRSELAVELAGRVDVGGASPQDHIDSYYIRNRIRRWLGTIEEHGEAGRVFPLYSMAGLQAAFALGAERRWQERLVFGVMRSLSPELAKMPFADRGWDPAAVGDLPDGADHQQPPVIYEGPRPVGWQRARPLVEPSPRRVDPPRRAGEPRVGRARPWCGGAAARRSPRHAQPRGARAVRCTHRGAVARGPRGAPADRDGTDRRPPVPTAGSGGGPGRAGPRWERQDGPRLRAGVAVRGGVEPRPATCRGVAARRPRDPCRHPPVPSRRRRPRPAGRWTGRAARRRLARSRLDNPRLTLGFDNRRLSIWWNLSACRSPSASTT